MTTPSVITHQLKGAIVAYDDGQLIKGVLIVMARAAGIVTRLQEDGAQLVEQGLLTLRLGVALFDRPFIFVPHSIIDEKGATIKGELVFDWLRIRAYEQPRSEVFGINANGEEDQVFAREIDVEYDAIVVGGPRVSPVYLVAQVGITELPPRFEAVLRVPASFDAAHVRSVVESV